MGTPVLIKGTCPLNQSSCFNIDENFILDAIHDIPGGVSPFLLKNIFETVDYL
jgi:hypothetical protein